MYANYLPETVLELGDYGDITKEGEFIRSGNIFRDHPSLQDDVEIGREPLGSNKDFFASRTRRKNTFSVITEEIPAIAECCPKLGWDIKKDRHAALVMIDANHHEIKFEGRLHRFIQNKPEVADKAFVTKVYRCSAYARLITEHGRSGRTYVGFNTNIDSTSTTSIATSTSSTGAAQVWQVLSEAGNWSTGSYHPSPPAYTPLVTIRQITPKEPASGFREPIPPAIADADEMQDYILPWGDLEEDGEEVDPDD
jgi:hypothetical protein